MQELQKALGGELDELTAVIDKTYLDARILTATAERLTEWENDIGLASKGRTLDQRRQFILSLLRGTGKLNEAKIDSIVNSFTGGRAISTFRDGTLTVKVLPPNNGEIYVFNDVEKSLSVRIPAHIGLSVDRFYSTWGDIKNDFTSWADVRDSFQDWSAVKNYIKGG